MPKNNMQFSAISQSTTCAKSHSSLFSAVYLNRHARKHRHAKCIRTQPVEILVAQKNSQDVAAPDLILHRKISTDFVDFYNYYSAKQSQADL